MDSKKFIDSIELPTLSKTLFEIIEVEKSKSASFLDDLKKIVERDPLLSAHILKVANSPIHGFSQKVRTISHAIGLLGIGKIRTMAFSFSIFDFLKKVDYKPAYGEVFNLILKKSLLISACSTILAKKINYLNSEELYASGLLSEIGELILFLHSPDTYCEIYSINDKKIIQRERERYKTDHVKLGVEFCDRYRLPNFFKTAIKNHAKLNSSEKHSKISFISNQIAELLLTENEEDKTAIFKELENYTKKLLHLSLSEIEETIKKLPVIMEAFIGDFPEVQKDLNKVIETGSSLIMSLMKKELDMVILTRELTDTQKKLAREKSFLFHMLNLSYFFSSLISPSKIISSLFEYFGNFIRDFTIEFIYKLPENGNYVLIKSKKDTDGSPFDINRFGSLVKSKISNEAIRLEKNEMEELNKAPTVVTTVFPISYHHNFFGFLLLDVEKKRYFDVEIDMTYVQILSNIIANSFQNYFSFENLKKETNKKKLVTKELFKFDKELNHSRESLIALQKAEILGELLPVIFHKLKNKLTPILGYSQILLSKVGDPAINKRIKKIEKNADELVSQLNALRDYFKIEKTTKEKDNLNNIIAHLKPYFNRVEGDKNIKIILEPDFSVPDDLLNCGQVEELIINIIDNAVTAIGKKGTNDGIIHIKTKNGPAADSYKLIIKDNGIGMKEENIPRIWSPFYSDFPGHPGIGLTVCERVVLNHDASYNIRSKEGEFTEFEITFKKTLFEKEEEIAGDVIKPPKSDIHGKILIVDDEDYLLDLMKEILLNEGDFEVVTTTSGKEAIRLVEDNSYDLVISDIRMPEVDGINIYSFLKSRQMETRVIMVTADPYSEDIAIFLKKNNVNYLKKPFELMKFKQKVLEKLSS